MNYVDKTVILTGAGFFGSHIKTTLENKNFLVHVIDHKDFDLKNYDDALDTIVSTRAKYLINCAAFSGGIAFNKKYPDQIFYDNTMMNLNILKAASLNNTIRRVISIVSSCAYPDKELLQESEFWDGLPNETIRYFGLQKRNLVAYSNALSNKGNEDKYKCLVFNNLFGPRDSLDVVRTKAVMNLIRKIVDAKINNEPQIIVWGSGVAHRQFTYVKDAAKWTFQAMLKAGYPSLLNMIGFQPEISILDLTKLICKLVDYNGTIVLDTSKPDGQLHKVLDNQLCYKWMGILEETAFEQGLEETIEYYKQTIQEESR